ncbi:hypothetical protein [Winogradskyella sp.]
MTKHYAIQNVFAIQSVFVIQSASEESQYHVTDSSVTALPSE